MHVGLNLIYLVPGETGGTEIVASELLPALAEARPDLQLTLFTNREAAAADGVWREVGANVTVPVRARNRVEWVRGEQLVLPRLANRAGVDIVHSLANTGPAWGRFRRVVTIHDLIHRVHPEAHFGARSLGMRMLVMLAARRSHRVITDSQSTRTDLVNLLGIDPSRVDVAPLGVGRPSRPTDEATIRRNLDLGARPLLLTASAKRPHKNLMRLVEALALIPPERRPVLALPGYPTPHEAQLRRRAAELGVLQDTRFLGWVAKPELEGLYAAASCFVFPSLYEGFGLPVLEAMTRGVPVTCSDRGSLREVAGDAARLFDPESPRSMAAAVEEILRDAALAERLRTAGHERAKCFTWQRTAQATLESYDRVMGLGPAGLRSGRPDTARS